MEITYRKQIIVFELFLFTVVNSAIFRMYDSKKSKLILNRVYVNPFISLERKFEKAHRWADQTIDILRNYEFIVDKALANKDMC